MIVAGSALRNRVPPGFATSRIDITTMTVAGEQPPIRTGEPRERIDLRILCIQPAAAGDPTRRPAAGVAECELRSEARATHKRDRRHDKNPGDHRRFEVLRLEILDEAGQTYRELRPVPKHAHE